MLSSKEALASQLRNVLAKYNRQKSSESLTNVMQLLLVKQLMAEMDINTSAGGEGATSGNHSKCKPMNATIAGSDLTGVIETMNATINQLVVKDMENRQAIYNLTAILTSPILEIDKPFMLMCTAFDVVCADCHGSQGTA